MEEHVKHVLEGKAAEVSNYLTSISFSCQHRLIDYGINFTLRQAENSHILTLSYSPKKNRWTPFSMSEWIKDVVIPLILPLLGEAQQPISKQKASTILNEQKVSSAEIYFAEARECLHVLEPFAEENIDFSVIFDFAQRGVQLTLHDPRFIDLDRQALSRVLEQQQQTDFIAVKEYLHQCLTVCGVTEN